MKLSNRNKLIIASVLVIVLAVAAFVALILPQFATLSDLDSRIAEADAGVSQAQTLLSQRQEIKARSAQTEAARMRLANQMPEAPELPSLIVELQDTINAAGLEFASIAPSQPTLADAGYSQIDVSISVRGTWQDTVDLLQRLPGLTRQVRVRSFSVVPFEVPDEDEGITQQVSTAIALQVYTMPSDIAPPAPATPEETQ